MPRISDRFLDCAVYLYLSRANAEEGASFGGAGVLISVPEGSTEPLTPDHAIVHHGSAYDKIGYYPHHLYIATNRHVGRSCHFVRLTKRDGGSEVLEVIRWFFHETSDLAVAPINWTLNWERDFALAAVPHFSFLSVGELRNIDAGPGDDTFTVGRFSTHDGRERNLPVVRFGNIAMLPLEPIVFEDEGPQNVFLIESRTVQGYSGSPVFLSIPPWELRDSGRNTLRQTLGKGLGDIYSGVNFYIRLLGVVSAFLPDQMEQNTGMMAAVPAWELLELLNYDALKEQRLTESERWKRDLG